METSLCECGCGTVIPKFGYRGDLRRFARNHHFKGNKTNLGKKHTSKWKELMSVKMKERYKNTQGDARFCLTCEKLIPRNCVPALYKNRNYCCQKCWFHRNPQLSKLCAYCKDEFFKPRRMPISRWNEQNCCSQSCAGSMKDNSHLKKWHKKGSESLMWKGGLTSEKNNIYNSKEYKQWRELVFKRDRWTCQICNKNKIPIEADHIKPFAIFPELRFDISNGRTLCESCHRETETYAIPFNRLGITKDNFEEKMIEIVIFKAKKKMKKSLKEINKLINSYNQI